jgi:hypothetical protein
MKVKLEIISSDEGRSVYLNETRIAGPKPCGGGEVVLTKWIEKAEVLEALESDCGDVLEPREV